VPRGESAQQDWSFRNPSGIFQNILKVSVRTEAANALEPRQRNGCWHERSAMKITSLLTKGLVVTAIATTMALGAGVVGASASDGRDERNTSGAEHERGSEHGHDDDDDSEENGRGHEAHGQGWGFGHGTDEDGDDESAPVVSVPVVDVPAAVEPVAEVPVDSAPDTTAPAAPAPDTIVTRTATPAFTLEVPATAAPTQTSPVAAPEVIRDVAESSATPTNDATLEISSNETASPASGSLPMTGASSFIVLGLAASLLAAGWLAIVGRRRNRKVVA
jgi:LPXTG-motif cell wall-anchored protein